MKKIKTLNRIKVLEHILLTVLLFLVIQGKGFAQFAGGTGTESDPWQITTLAQLNAIRNNQGGYYKLMNNLVFTPSDDFNGVNEGNFDPIPYFSSFRSFDGNGKTITGLVISQTGNYVGLFSSMGDSCNIRNLGLVNCNITGSYYVGGIIGKFGGHGKIANCFVSGTITATATAIANNLGGIIGGNDGSSEITSCFVSGTVIATGGNLKSVGGIAGAFSGSINVCCNAATVSSPSSSVGGIVGNANACLNTCYNIGAISGSSSTGAVIGSGSKSMAVNCFYLSGTAAAGCGYTDANYSLSTVSLSAAEMKAAAFVTSLNSPYFTNFWKAGGSDNNGYPVPVWLNGGTVDHRGETADNPILITNLQDLNKIRNYIQFPRFFKLTTDLNLSSAGNFEPIGNGSSNYGYPVAGEFDGNNHKITGLTVSRSYYAGLFGCMSGNIKNLTVENTTVSGGWSIGGIAGSLNGNIVNCSFLGTVSGTGYNIGGMLGELYGSIINCTSSATVTTTTGFNVGGLVGSIQYGYVTRKCTNKGAVTGRSTVGGIAGTMMFGIVDTCVNTGAINGVDGGSSISGLFGSLLYASMTDCHNSGTVNAPGCNGVSGLGGGNLTTALRCFNEGNITGNNTVSGIGAASSGCYNTGNITGNNYVGGIDGTSLNTGSDFYGTTIGWSSGYASGSYLQPSQVGCYNIGEVTGNQFVGGITPGKYISGGCFYIQGKVQSQDKRIIEVEEGAQGVTEAQLKSQMVVNAMNVALYNKAFATFNKYYWSATATGYPAFNAQPGSSPVPLYNVSLSVAPFAAPIEVDGIRFNTKANGKLAQIQLEAGDYPLKIADYADNTMQTLHVASSGTNGMTLNSGITSISDGNGSGIYQLATPEHLHLMRYANGSAFELLNDIVFTSDKDFSLTAGNFYPIIFFSGSLNGKGHAIKNLSIQADSLDNVGLFADISASKTTQNSQRIRNLTLENVNIRGRNYVGAIGGKIFEGTKVWPVCTDSCRITGSVSGVDNVGGLYGYGSSTISMVTNESNVQGANYTGGIVGRYSSVRTISDAINRGTVTGVENVGGIAGNNAGIIQNSYNYGAVSGITVVGGVAGYLEGTVTNCLNKGAITASQSGAVIGGIAGKNSKAVIGSCNLGAITVSGGLVKAGGIAGTSYSQIKACYNAGKITVSGSGYVGGLVGYSGNGNGFMGSTGKDSCSYNAGSIEADNANAGTLFGYIDNRLSETTLAALFSKLYYLQDTTQNINVDIPAIGLWEQPTGLFPEMPVALTVEQLRQSNIIDSLNCMSTPLWKADLPHNINNGFPILIWQTEGIVNTIPQTKPNSSVNVSIITTTDAIYITAEEFRNATVYDITGRKIEGTNRQIINISQLPHGLYLLQISTTKGVTTKKFIKQ